MLAFYLNTQILIKKLIFIARFGKDKIALFLACASILGGKNSLAAVKPGLVREAVISSKKMSNLTRGFTIGSLILGSG